MAAIPLPGVRPKNGFRLPTTFRHPSRFVASGGTVFGTFPFVPIVTSEAALAEGPAVFLSRGPILSGRRLPIMSNGLKTTFQFLSKTENEAAVDLLISALDSPHSSIQEAALRAVLDRRSVVGQREVLRRIRDANARWRAILDDRRGRLSQALRDAILGQDLGMCDNACQALLWFHEYDLMPTLVNAMEDETNPNSSVAATTLLNVAELLYEELAAPLDSRRRRDPQLVRRNVTGCLEQTIVHFGRHKRVEPVEAFLLLTARDNAVLRRVLNDPLHSAYLVLIERLTHSPRAGIMRLVLSFLDDPQPPSAALNALAHRTDRKFVEYLLRKIGSDPTLAAKANLKHVESIAWLRTDLKFLDELDDAGQHSAVQLMKSSAMPRPAVFAALEYLLVHGKTRGRQAAIAALAAFNGVQANQLALQAMNDVDPQVQATAVAQLRPRGIPGSLSMLIDALENPFLLVQQAARESLSEFSFNRYLSAFDLLDEEVRQSTGKLVRKVDPLTLPLLGDELRSGSRRRRIRGVVMAVALGLSEQLEPDLIELMADEDHLVRMEAARALVHCDTRASRIALSAAQHDTSVAVKMAAQRSLEELGPIPEPLQGPPSEPLHA